MRINNNISAMNTYSRLNSANNAKAGSLAKLSSGLRINRAGDDAAGLAISEKMRGQIGGLKQATRNAQDGISMIQTAEGALSETHSILQRMRELSVQASSDTNTTDDRKEIQKEMNQLTSEITRIGNTTEFNTQKVLKGGGTAKVPGSPAEYATASNLAVTEDTPGAVGAAAVYSFTLTEAAAGAGDKITVGGEEFVLATGGDATETAAELVDLINGNATLRSRYTATNAAGKITLTAPINGVDPGEADITAGVTYEKMTKAAVPASGGEFKATLQIGANQSQSFEVEIGDMRASSLGLSGAAEGQAVGATDTAVTGAIFAKAADTDALTDVSADGTAEYGLDLSSSEKASAAITVVDQAIATVSAERSKLGSVQNRLDHTINNLTATAENLTEAESRIRDVDMAEEMMSFTKNNILSQAATSMLAQANQMPQSVLQLLQ